MTTPIYCIDYSLPTLDVDKHIGRPVLRWLADRRAVILWRMQGLYGLITREHVAELDRLYKQDPKSNIGFVWSACTRVSPEIGAVLFSE